MSNQFPHGRLVEQLNETRSNESTYKIDFTFTPTSSTARDPFFTQTEIVAFGSVIVLLSVIGLVLNTVTFFAILLNQKLRKSVFNIFISSLCVSDFLSSISSPLTLFALFSYQSDYPFPGTICKLHTAVDIWTTICTIQHILVFSLLRLIAISYPLYIRRITILMANIGVAFIWMETFGVSFIPYFLFNGVFKGSTLHPDVLTCRPDTKTIMIFVDYVKYAFPIMFYVPMVLVIICSCILLYLMVQRKVSKASLGNGRKTKDENFAIIQLSLILLSFMIGYIPDVARRLFNANNSIRTRADFLFYTMPIFTLRLSECLNPVFYNISSSSIRNASVDFLKRLSCQTIRASTNSSTIKNISGQSQRSTTQNQTTKFTEQQTRVTAT